MIFLKTMLKFGVPFGIVMGVVYTVQILIMNDVKSTDTIGILRHALNGGVSGIIAGSLFGFYSAFVRKKWRDKKAAPPNPEDRIRLSDD